MSAIETILFAPCVAFVLVEVLQIKNWLYYRNKTTLIKIYPFNRKPFTCTTCMGGWCALIIYGFNWQTIPIMCASMVTTIFLSQLIKRV